MQYPKPDDVYVPVFTKLELPPTIEYVREHGKVVYADGDVGTVEVVHGSQVFFCAVTLNPDGTIKDIVSRSVNTYTRKE